LICLCFFLSSRRRHTRFSRDWSSDVCSSDLFIGDDDYSSYFEASYSIPTSFVDIDLILGATPAAGYYSDGFAVVVTAIKATKEISVSDSFSIPVYTQAVLNPDSKDVFLLFGMKF